MKIDRSRLKKSTSEVPIECQVLIDKLRGCRSKELLWELKQIDTWTFGKCELYHWIDILDISDTILEEAASRKGSSWALACDLPENSEEKELLLWILHFTTLLIEHSFSRHLYSSMEHLITLLQSCDMNVVLGVLNLLYMFSKRSNFITRLMLDKRQALVSRLTYLAETWGGKENGFGLAECSRESPISSFPPSSTTLHFEFYPEGEEDKTISPKSKLNISSQVVIIRIENIDKLKKTPSQIMDELMEQYKVPEDSQMQLYTHIRLACSFSNWPLRLLSVQARLQALSVLVYSNALADNAHSLLYTGILEELVELLELQYPYLMEIRAAALRTLTSIIHLDRNPHFPKKPGSRLNMIIDVTGANSYHGFLPALVRTCITSLTSAKRPPSSSGAPPGPFPLPLATALFSFLYHLASYEAGGESLVSCGMMESLLRVINWPGKELEHITFVTRAVRVIDLITNIDMQAFQTHGGLSSFINRLEMEVKVCRKEQPFEIMVKTPFNDENLSDDGLEVMADDAEASTSRNTAMSVQEQPAEELGMDDFLPAASTSVRVPFPTEAMEDRLSTDETPASPNSSFDRGEHASDAATAAPSTESPESPEVGVGATTPETLFTTAFENYLRDHRTDAPGVSEEEPFPDDEPFLEEDPFPPQTAGTSSSLPDYSASKTGKTCLPQRAALLKSMLNFLKKAIQDPAFSDSIRHVMEGSLPASLKHIISNAEYYGPSLFLLATDVVTVYVFQEPSLLSSLQDNGLTDVVLHALLVKDVPATREVLGSLPNVFSALCLNARGLASFVTCEPFERLFKVLLSPTYLAAMRRRRSSDPMGDTASNLGNAMDELMRHQPILKIDATTAIIKLLEELCVLGRDPKYVCWRAQKGLLDYVPAAAKSNSPADAGSSDEEEEDEEEASTSSHPQRDDSAADATAAAGTTSEEKTPIALIDYILNVMKFIDAILSNNSTDDHCKEFVRQNGLGPLLSILALPNLPVDYPVTTAALGVASVCKSILNLAHEPSVLKTGLNQLRKVLAQLEPLHKPHGDPGTSVLLHELATAPNLEAAFSTYSSTPLLHAMGAAHGYVLMFVHVCRTGQSEIRNLSLVNWGSQAGLGVLRSLAELYVSLVWESTLLLALCSDDCIPAGCRFGADDMDKLLPPEVRGPDVEAATGGGGCSSSSGSTSGSDTASNGMTSAMEALSTDPVVGMDVDEAGAAAGATDKPKDHRAVPTAVQLKYIKPLLGASSRLGRALAELFGLLVKLCVGSPIRARRGQVIPNQPTLPTPSARAVSAALNELLARGLSFGKLPKIGIPKFKLTFLICSVGFTSPMLFDEKKYPYHLMLHRFVQQGGQSTFYECMRWALSGDGLVAPEDGLEYPDLPESTGEFLDACLLLLEKMVNPKAILDSPHTTSGPKSTTFDPLKYLLKTHQDAFDMVMLMWGKKPLATYGHRMSDSMLAILRHILRGEKILGERLTKELVASPSDLFAPGSSGAAVVPPTTSTGAGGPVRRPPRAEVPEVNANHLRQLMDMGFSREHCREALLSSPSVEAATDFLLISPGLSTHVTQQSTSMDLDEEDQMVRAIAMSLGEKVAEKIRGGKEPTPVSPVSKGDQLKEDWESLHKFQKVIDTFTVTALSSCLSLLDMLPDQVYRICDLLVTISKRNGQVWRDKMLRSLVDEMSDKVNVLLKFIENEEGEQLLEELVNSEAARKAAGRIHLFTLLFEGPVYTELRIPCAQVVQESNVTPLLVLLLCQAQAVMSAYVRQGITLPGTPKWLTPLLLLIDLLEKVSVCTKRKERMHQVTSRTWKWFDLTAGRWTPYTQANNKLINDAYWNGEQAIRINCGRRRYTLQFSIMCQMNEESANRRPITMALTEKNGDKKKDKKVTTEKDKPDRMDIEEQTLHEELEKKQSLVIEGLSKEFAREIVRACVGLISVPIERDCLHAVMRMCLRLTRDYEHATTFAEEGGVKLLLDLTSYSAFTGVLPLATLIIRHVIEDPSTLRLSMEKVLRAKTLANIPPGYKELLYLLRNTNAAVCRDPDAFLEVAKRVLRVDCNILVLRRNEEEDTRLLLKTLPYRPSTVTGMTGEVATNAIFQLLNSLGKKYPSYRDFCTSPVSSTPTTATSTATSTPTTLQNLAVAPVPTPMPAPVYRACAGNPLNPDEITEGVREYERERLKRAKEELLEEDKKRPLLPKSAILKLLAEAVRSYAGCARLITDHVYHAGQSDLVSEDCSALAFLLDHLLPLSENPEDRECSTMSRMLVAAIASCNHSPDAQSVLVTEVRSSLLRTLAMPESTEKHVHIQVLAGLVSTMVENCPPTPSTPMPQTLKLQQFSNNMNNIVRIILRKGLLVDLARVAHHLDLSSPNMPASLNATLKPLETLSRIVNQPTTTPIVKGKPKPMNAVPASRNLLDAGTNSNGAGNAQTGGQDPLEDVDNSELDISAGTIEQFENVIQEVQRDAAILDYDLESLLEGNGTVNGRNIGPQEIIDAQYRESQQMLRSAQHEMDVEEDHLNNHGHEGMQANTPFANDDDEGGDIDQGEESDDSDSDSNASDDAGEVHDVGEGDDEDDDDDDDDGDDNEDEEENGSGYDEEEVEFFESDEGLFRIPSLDRDNEEILMIQYSDLPENAAGALVPWNTSTFPLPLGLFEDTFTGNDVSDMSNNITASHPLLMARHQLEMATVAAASRAVRANRQRRYQYLQLNPRNPNPPVILQRLLGPAASQNLSTTPGQAMPVFGDSRVVLMDNGLGIFTQNEEEQIDFVDQSGYLFGPSLAATLSNVPTALHWWNEEAKLLDGDSLAACCTWIASELVPDLEKYRDLEMEEQKEKRMRAQIEDEVRRKEEELNSSLDSTLSDPGTAVDPLSLEPSAPDLDTVSRTAGNTILETLFPAADPSAIAAVIASTVPASTVAAPPTAPANAGAPPPDEPDPNASHFDSLDEDDTDDDDDDDDDDSDIIPGTPPRPTRRPVVPQVIEDSDNDETTPPVSENNPPVLSPMNSDDQRRRNLEAVVNLAEELRRRNAESANVDVEYTSPDAPSGAAAMEAYNREWYNNINAGDIENPNVPFIGSAHVEASRIPVIATNPPSGRPQESGDEPPPAGAAPLWSPVQLPASGGGDQATAAAASAAAPSTGNAQQAAGGSAEFVEVPEGVDPSFLAALPEEMRVEVVAEQLRLQRIRQRAAQVAAGESEPAAVTVVNPEFLAALPPSIQEEVLAQQRQEQQRQAAITANPEDPVDTAAFFENLPPSLRQAILTDMEESQIAALPPEIAQEAQSLRREWETRHRQLMQDRFFSHVSHNNTALSSILRNSAAGRVGARYAIHTVPQRAQWGGAWNARAEPLPAIEGSAQGTLRLRGRQLLDHEALSCLLVLLFVDEPKLNTGRLHRVLRNLCYHGPTRDWVIRALISIMAHCNDSRPTTESGPFRHRIATRSQTPTVVLHAYEIYQKRNDDMKKAEEAAAAAAAVTTPSTSSGRSNASPSWLNISLDAALGCRASVFSVARHPGKRGGGTKAQDTITIHPQAAPIVFRHTLEVLISLAKSFPRYFLPHKKDVESTSTGTQTKDAGTAPKEGGATFEPKKTSSPRSGAARSEQTDFWEMLVKLDSLTSKKGKSVARAHSSSSLSDDFGNPTNFETSAFGLLIKMLPSPVVKRSTQLTDKLLRLLSLISIGLPDCHIYLTRLQRETDSKKPDEQEDRVAIPEEHLRLAIEVLTSKSCSEEGLEDATALLLNLSNCPEPTREMILQLLLSGALELSDMVNEHIKALLKELKAMHVHMKRMDQQDSTETPAIDRERPNRGVLNDRFTKDNVVVSAPAKLKGGCDLQLPSMAMLTSKTSSQAFFLRILKVITQIRESIRLSQKNKKKSANTSGTSEGSGEASGSGLSRAPLSSDEVAAAGATMPQYVPQPGRRDGEAEASAEESGDTEVAEDEAPASADMDTDTDANEHSYYDPLIESRSPVTSPMSRSYMDLPRSAPAPVSEEWIEEPTMPSLSEILSLDRLWETLSACLLELADTPDHHAVLVLQPAVEAFFLVHASAAEETRTYDATDAANPAQVRQPFDFDTADVAPVSPLEPDAEGGAPATPERPTALNINWEVSPSPVNLPPDQQKFLKFAETHRTVLNQILRQSTTHLADGPFAVLVDHTRVLDFDVKRRYFRSELERLDEGIRREELAVHVRRNNVFEDSFRELHRRSADEWKNRFYIVFEGEEGQDAGGLLREWYVIISREIFNPMYALFTTSPGDRVTYMINSTSHCNPNHLCYFKFVGRVIAKAIYDNKLLECYFTRSFYKHILGILVKYTDMETEDFSFYSGLVYLMENSVSTVGYELTFSTEVQEFGVTEVRDLIPNGRNIFVNEQTKMDYIRLVCQMKMTGAIRKQINAFLEGFYDIIPKRLIAIFNEQELELLISGLPNVDIEDLRSNTEYHKYQTTSLQIQWFWRALRSFDQADRAKFLQFVTGTSKVPLQGFGALEGMNGVQKFQIHRDDRSTDRLPSAHTCFNQLDLPVYETYNKLNRYLQKAIHECSEGFGFA